MHPAAFQHRFNAVRGKTDRGNSGSDMTRFLIVEDQVIFSRQVSRVIERTSEAVPATTLAEARALLEEDDDDLIAGVLLDVHLPDGSGLDLLEEIRATRRALPVLVMTGDDTSPTDVNRAQLFGAQFVYKPEVTPNIVAFVARVEEERRREAAARREALRSQHFRKRIRLCVKRYATMHGLSDREAEVLERSAQGVTRAELAQELALAENTVKTIIRRTLQKTGARSLREMLHALLEDAAQTT